MQQWTVQAQIEIVDSTSVVSAKMQQRQHKHNIINGTTNSIQTQDSALQIQ